MDDLQTHRRNRMVGWAAQRTAALALQVEAKAATDTALGRADAASVLVDVNLDIIEATGTMADVDGLEVGGEVTVLHPEETAAQAGNRCCM